jgi:hypothetical protein
MTDLEHALATQLADLIRTSDSFMAAVYLLAGDDPRLEPERAALIAALDEADPD